MAEISTLIDMHESFVNKVVSSNENLKNATTSELSLIDLTRTNPIIPSPWSSEGDGEGWLLGDYLLTFQKQPKELCNMTLKEAPKVLFYLYSITVFLSTSKKSCQTFSLSYFDGSFGKMYS